MNTIRSMLSSKSRQYQVSQDDSNVPHESSIAEKLQLAEKQHDEYHAHNQPRSFSDSGMRDVNAGVYVLHNRHS